MKMKEFGPRGGANVPGALVGSANAEVLPNWQGMHYQF